MRKPPTRLKKTIGWLLSAFLLVVYFSPQAQLLRTPRIVGPRRMLRAYPKLRHGSKLRSLPTLREMLHRAEQENKDDNKNTK